MAGSDVPLQSSIGLRTTTMVIYIIIYLKLSKKKLNISRFASPYILERVAARGMAYICSCFIFIYNIDESTESGSLIYYLRLIHQPMSVIY